MHRTKEIRTDLPHRIFRTFIHPHGMSARIFRTEFSAQGSSARIFRTFLNFFLTFFKDVLPIVSINTILLKFRQLLQCKKCMPDPDSGKRLGVLKKIDTLPKITLETTFSRKKPNFFDFRFNTSTPSLNQSLACFVTTQECAQSIPHAKSPIKVMFL